MAYSAESHYGAKSGPGVLPRLGRSGRKLVRYRVTGRALKRRVWLSLLKLESPPRRNRAAGCMAATENRCAWIPPIPRIAASIPPFGASERVTRAARQRSAAERRITLG